MSPPPSRQSQPKPRDVVFAHIIAAGVECNEAMLAAMGTAGMPARP
ncbi:hypothetical protein [Streptosporangium lutulentum]|uniref:Uncharacterized protein n=1 Tax=Streptosporangium lutulentum TaxID=1461250 RepID=A0ABT9QVH0_9ACTN|nr:hypothetical protein [Streptosporangium lutulentum]MDP9850430.1 hypothetical protein [Streptosporangium lutulentum]